MRAHIDEKRFGGKLVLSGLDMEIGRGDRIAVTGPSGRGKTTLLRIIAGLDRDFSGSISEPFSRPAVLFQEDRLVEALGVLSNLRAVSDDRARILQALGGVGLAAESGSIVSTLSGGMKRRLAIARLVLLDKDAVFLDEPFRALDAESRRLSAQLLLSWAGDSPLLFVTHDDDDIELLGATRILSL